MVAAGLVEECLVQFGYCIGRAVPVSVMVNSQGTDKLADKARIQIIRNCHSGFAGWQTGLDDKLIWE